MKLNFKKNVSLAPFSTFKIGGKADYLFVAQKKEEVVDAIKWAKAKKLPFFILGGGSNILFSDRGFRGLVIKMQNSRYEIGNSGIFAEAGTPLQKLVIESVKAGWMGFEWAIGIPGTLGGAIRGNAGAFGREMKDTIERVEVLDINKMKIKEMKNEDCQFSYRESIFKKNKNLVILSAILKLKKGNKERLKEILKQNLEYRKRHQPIEALSAGCIFKNIPLNKVPKGVQEKFADRVKKDSLFPTALLVSTLFPKNFSVGGAKISEKHSNFIINFKRAKASDILSLIKLIRERVKKKFGISLEEEIELVGFNHLDRPGLKQFN